MNHQLQLKLQLPIVFTPDYEVELELIDFVFDPSCRLEGSKEIKKYYSQTNVASIIDIIKEYNKKTLKIYDNKNWQSILRPLQLFAFQLELKVKVKQIKQTSIKAKSLENKSRKNFYYSVLTIDLDALPSEEELTKIINDAACALCLKASSKPCKQSLEVVSLLPQKIFNPHLFIKTQQKQKYQEYYTKGIYQYYHYGDQSFNDHGWGCAYRSLQTVLSWFNLQNHCKIPVMPTIVDIQDMIDKINLGSIQKLKNSRQWIGATEVSWIIKKLTNYDCRILHISDGKDIMEHCEVLREHFEKVGCPVMYGGGQYAYSIVGLNYSWQLGECEFLILDPHYPGQDSLEKLIQKKGLSWRKPDEMFKKGIFYNFCLPIVISQE